MKRIIVTLLSLALAALACNLGAPQAGPSDFPTRPPDPTAQPTLAASPATLSAEQIRNASLTISGSDNISRTISFKDGKYELGTDPAQNGYVSVSMGEEIAFGDLNADGAQDAIISIGENYGGTGVFVSVVAILNENGQPSAVASALIDDRAILNSISITDGEVGVDATIHGPADPMCCPSMPSARSYRLVENRLELMNLSTKTPTGNARVILIEAPASGAEVSGPFSLTGSVSISPFENNLVYRIYQQGSNLVLDEAGFIIKAEEMGGPGTFELPLDFSKKGFKGALRIEILDISPADGATLAMTSLIILSK